MNNDRHGNGKVGEKKTKKEMENSAIDFYAIIYLK